MEEQTPIFLQKKEAPLLSKQRGGLRRPWTRSPATWDVTETQRQDRLRHMAEGKVQGADVVWCSLWSPATPRALRLQLNNARLKVL